MATPDVIVVGGGVIGLAAAYELARRDLAVLVLERGAVGGGCTSIGGGFACGVSQISRDMAALTDDSQHRYQELAEELGADLGLRVCGCLLLAADDDEAAMLHRRWELSEPGRGWDWLSPEAAADLEPLTAPGVRGAVHAPADVQIDPSRLMVAYRDAVERLGGEIREGQVTIGLRREQGRVVGVQTRLGVLDAGCVLLATGCWTPALLPHTHASLVRPRRGQVLVGRPRRRGFHKLLLGADYLRSKRGSGEVGFSLEQTVDGAVRLGGSREWAGFDWRPSALMARIEDNAARYVRLPDGLEWSHAAAGLRPATADGMPLIGQLERGLWLAVGHEGNGFATAPATALRVTAGILGEPSDLRAFHPGRFMTPPEARAGSSSTFGSAQSRGPDARQDWD